MKYTLYKVYLCSILTILCKVYFIYFIPRTPLRGYVYANEEERMFSTFEVKKNKTYLWYTLKYTMFVHIPHKVY